MSRLDKFNSFEKHAWLHKAFKKLKSHELAIAREFLVHNQSLDKGDFELKVNRMFIDKEKPKNWSIIMELLCNSNI